MLVVTACSTGSKNNFTSKRNVIDASKVKQAWVDGTKMAWAENGKFYSKATHTIRGDQRLDACISLAKLDAKENLLTAMSEDVKGAMDHADLDISENAETILGKVRSAKWEGSIYGLQFPEQYYERYEIDGTERIDCSVLSEISMNDYNKTKQTVINKVSAADPAVKQAITKKQVDFFSTKETTSRNPSENKEE